VSSDQAQSFPIAAPGLAPRSASADRSVGPVVTGTGAIKVLAMDAEQPHPGPGRGEQDGLDPETVRTVAPVEPRIRPACGTCGGDHPSAAATAATPSANGHQMGEIGISADHFVMIL
jgi:hypothetical protein